MKLQDYVVRQIEFPKPEGGFNWHTNKHVEFICANKGMIVVRMRILNSEIYGRYDNGDYLTIPAGVEHVINPINSDVKSFLLIEHQDDVGPV